MRVGAVYIKLGLPMQAFTHFSRHAFERIEQRTKLPCEEIARILDRKLALNTGRKPGFNRNHLLFYSAPDDDFYVAIQDGLTGTIVTVLPLDYHANLAWSVPPEDCIKAKKLYLNAPVEDAQTQPASNATLFVISGHFLDGGGNQKTKVLQKLSSLPYENDIKKLLSDQDYFAKLDLLAAEKGIDAKRMFGISIRLGNHGAPIAIELQEVPSPNNALQWDAPQAARP